MKISVVTPTCDRPIGVRFLEGHMRRQTVQPDEWIVVDSGSIPAELTMGQTVFRNMRPPGPQNLATNILTALSAVTGDVVIIFEDDDYYFDTHIEESVNILKGQPVCGDAILRYYNVQHRCWAEMRNQGSALCQTSFRREKMRMMESAAQEAMVCRDYGIDRRFWQFQNALPCLSGTVVGIKGLPGTKGLGIGHRPLQDRKKRWVEDPSFSKLEDWLGAEEALPYTRLQFED